MANRLTFGVALYLLRERNPPPDVAALLDVLEDEYRHLLLQHLADRTTTNAASPLGATP